MTSFSVLAGLNFVRCFSQISAARLAMGWDAAAMFLFAHLNIEILHLDIGEGGPLRPHLTLPHESLPRLRELKANNWIAASIISCPTISTTPRPLETLKGICLTGTTEDERLMKSLRAGGGTVKRLELVGWSEHGRREG